MSFRDEAIAEYERQRQERAQAEAQDRQEQARQNRLQFVQDFGREPDGVDEETGNLMIDGVTLFPRYYDSHRYWHVVGACPRCGAVHRSERCRTLADIGAQLVLFEPDWPHHCQVIPGHELDVGDTAKRFAFAAVDLLRELIAQETDVAD